MKQNRNWKYYMINKMKWNWMNCQIYPTFKSFNMKKLSISLDFIFENIDKWNYVNC
jgi:hypothetical protein